MDVKLGDCCLAHLKVTKNQWSLDSETSTICYTHTVEIFILREIVLYENNTIFSYDFHDIILSKSEVLGFLHCWSSILWEILEFPHSVCVKVAFAITNSYVNPVTYYPIFYLGIGSTCYKKSHHLGLIKYCQVRWP